MIGISRFKIFTYSNVELQLVIIPIHYLFESLPPIFHITTSSIGPSIIPILWKPTRPLPINNDNPTIPPNDVMRSGIAVREDGLVLFSTDLGQRFLHARIVFGLSTENIVVQGLVKVSVIIERALYTTIHSTVDETRSIYGLYTPWMLRL
jgi:hypothetical protein